MRFLLALIASLTVPHAYSKVIAAVGTWDFSEIALCRSVALLRQHVSSTSAVEAGINKIELDTQDQYFVGVGGYPNEHGIMELDAAMMEGTTMKYGAVMALRNIKTPISVARSIMEQCFHNILVGDGALEWAISHGFESDVSVLTPSISEEWQRWKSSTRPNEAIKDPDSHDTIGVICLDHEGHMTVGTSTSGWKYKLSGRVGDSPLIGSGLYCDGTVGGAVATGDGEEIMRCCLSFLVVELMRAGLSPREACAQAISRLSSLPGVSLTGDSGTISMHSRLTVGVIAMDRHGNIGAASTLSQENQHRGKSYFPVVCYRQEVDSLENKDPEFTIIQASLAGAVY